MIMSRLNNNYIKVEPINEVSEIGRQATARLLKSDEKTT